MNNYIETLTPEQRERVEQLLQSIENEGFYIEEYNVDSEAGGMRVKFEVIA